MKTITATRAALVVTFLVSLPLATTAQNLIVNGSFELGLFQPLPDGFEDLTVGSTTMQGWTVTTDTISRGINGNVYGISASDGALLLDLAAHDNVLPHGGVAQSVATTIGQIFHVSLDLGTYQDNPSSVGPITVSVAAGASLMSFIHNPAGIGNQWTSYGFDFTAASAITLIAINGISGINYIGVDNVAVVPVPEPSMLALFTSSGVLLIGAIRCRRGKICKLIAA